MNPFRVGIDSYCLHPLRLSPLEMLEWVADRGGEGVQFSEGLLAADNDTDEGFLRELGETARSNGMYLEWGGSQHVPFDTATWKKRDLTASNRRAAESAHTLGATVVRSCSGGFFRWESAAPDTDTLLESMAKCLRPQRPVFEDLGVTLAIELHFEFTTFELLRLFDMCDVQPGGWLGVCLDTFNMLPMLEDPVAGTERVLPWVAVTHIKDGAVTVGGDGFVTFPTELGHGQVDIPAILDLLSASDPLPNLSVEDHGGSFTTQIHDAEFLKLFPDLTEAEMGRLLELAHAGRERVDRGICRPTDRGDWPEICEERTGRDLQYLKQLVAEGPRRSG
jgi:sugar phosphate isomerase/epimerase